MDLIIRKEEPADAPAIRALNEEAFGQPAEANIVDRLRRSCGKLLSLVAILDGEVVGHILFSPVTIDGASGAIEGMGLAPMAVTPPHQRKKIGSRLVRHGLDVLRKQSCPFVVLVGHPESYPRFGFEPASGHAITSQWEGMPDEAFMVLVLDGSAMTGVSGVARYRSEFDEAG